MPRKRLKTDKQGIKLENESALPDIGGVGVTVLTRHRGGWGDGINPTSGGWGRLIHESTYYES
ncbi:MAG: hypothetical protein DWQ58_22730 [Microcystis aeruginosa TA09]|nr:MAG: hypothetical protein DWQ58_22730 [Microcystis aeruginosa TA09]